MRSLVSLSPRARSALVALTLLLPVVVASRADAYQLLGSAWDADRGPVPFHLEPNGSDDIDDGSDLDAVRSAFRRWSCVEGSRLRLVEGEGAGAKEGESGDGRNSVFWDEDGTFGLGVATLGITLGPSSSPGEALERTWATIVFNGVHHAWSTSDDHVLAADVVDVESIAVHEAGHWIGLDHPCEDPQETVCKGPDEAVMTPTYPGGLLRELRADDEAGARALYPQDDDDDSTCQGPYRQGERCSCNDECVEGLLCVPSADGRGLCAPRCSADDVSCPLGFTCVLSAAGDEGVAPGMCRKLGADGAPPGAVCQRDDECAEGLCANAGPVGRTVCRSSCSSDDDCPSAHACTDGVCLSSADDEGIVCGSDLDDGGCACTTSRARTPPSPGAPFGVALVVLVLVGLFAARKARGPRRQPGANQARGVGLR